MITYKFRGRETREWGLIVNEGVGLLDPLTPKRNRYTQIELHRHGEMMNRAKVYFESRKISLKCTLIGDSATQFSERAAALKNVLFERNSFGATFRLEVVTPAKYPLEYEVYCTKISGLSSVRWRKGVMAASLTIDLVEPEPIKRVYKLPKGATRVQIENPLGLQLSIYKSKREYFKPQGGVTLEPTPRALLDAKDKTISVLYDYDPEEDYLIITGDLNEDSRINVPNTIMIWK